MFKKMKDQKYIYFEGNDSISCKPDYYDVVLLNTNFDIRDLYNYQLLSQKTQNNICKDLRNLLDICFAQLKQGGLLFVYGIPKYLILYSGVLNQIKNETSKFLFKYWISVGIDQMESRETLKPNHLGLLTYLKTKKGKNTTPFHLNTKQIRVPHEKCHFCNQFLKDYGGYKDRRNPKGACLSDVWRDLKIAKLKNHIIPENLKNRVIDLVKNQKKDFRFSYLIEKDNIIKKNIKIEEKGNNTFQKSLQIINKYTEIEKNIIIETDCLNYMKKISKEHTSGVFDLIFADPPYNLEKEYFTYEDDLQEKDYLSWCQKWISYGIELLKPGGSFLILNLPKWSIYLAKYLLNELNFRHWIVWDAMSRPNGKIMPSHYSLLYFTKPGASHTFNYNNKNNNSDLLNPIDSNVYCLREKCIKKRKEVGEDLKVDLTDIWWDIYRIKHNKDRNHHPCQLPLKLMIRIINMTTNPGDIVFDPFCGTGTTSLAAKILNRNYISTEIDKNYILISNKNLNESKKFENNLKS